MMKGFQTRGELMEAVRALDYKAQYKVCEAFYKLSKGFDWSDRLMFQRFEESFSMIDADNGYHKGHRREDRCGQECNR